MTPDDKGHCRRCDSALNKDTDKGTDALVCTNSLCPLAGEPQGRCRS